MKTLAIVPSSASYAATPSSPVISTQLDGGLPRLRADQVGAVAQVRCQWQLNPLTFQYMQAFYRVIGYGAQAFLINLIIDTPSLQQYTATIEPASWVTSSIEGATYFVGATLNVLPKAQDAAFDEALVDLYGAIGDQIDPDFSELAHLVNVVLPESIPGDD